MKTKIKILHLEDSFKDSELIRSIIESGEFEIKYFLTDNENDFINCLKTEHIDIILSDYSLPGYKGSEALKFAKQNYAHIPFIFVSGTIGEDRAINAMLNGATDYVIKNKLERLVPAIKRVLRELELETKRERIEKDLKIKNDLIEAQKEDKAERAEELIIANKELAFQNKEKENRAAELIIANKELIFQNKLKEKRADELVIANKELAFQNKEKEKRAKELIIANNELIFQNNEKEKRAAELIIANKELAFQNKEKEKRADELIIAKEKAEESDQLKTAFLQNMSHEIRTPLNGIIGFSSLLISENISASESKEYSTIIAQSGNRLLDIVNNVLDISKIQTGQVKIEIKSIDIDTVLLNLYNFFSPLANAKNINLNYHEYKGQNPIIFSDETKLNQILTNLINNAIKFTKSGKIDFGFEIIENFIQFYVRDTGIGIPKELHDRVFVRFIQAEQTRTRNYEGAGLGLAISKGLVELLEGKIWVESIENEGSTFFFTIPYKPSLKLSQSVKEYSKFSTKREHSKILIAEDDWVSFHFLNRVLGKFGINIIRADNGKQAVELVSNTPDIDLVLMDIKMPVMNGIEAIKLIKKMRPELPIIAQTAFAFKEEKNKVLSLGCNEYLVKPLDISKLDELINKYLN